MNFEFFKLANVDENSTVSNDTFALVINENEVQKTKSNLLTSKFYKDFTDEYEEWASHQQQTQQNDIETFVKTLITQNGMPYVGYIESSIGGTAMFDVAGDGMDSKQHLEVFYETIVLGQTVKNLKVCDFYNSEVIAKDTYSIIDGQLKHLDESDSLSIVGNSNELVLTNNSINFRGASKEIFLTHENDGCLKVHGDNDNSIIVRGVATPESGTDAANKDYVDNKAASLDENGILSFG